MRWVSGLRSDTLYTIEKRPLDPTWSNQDLQILLGWCATAQNHGWSEDRAFQTAEAIVFKSKYHGISWLNDTLNDDIQELLNITREQHKS